MISMKVKSLARRVVSKLDPFFATRLKDELVATANLVEVGNFDEQDVFIAGYPKSGNTWFQNLVAGIVYGIDTKLAPDTLIQELVVDIHYKKYFTRFSTPMFFKTHFLPQPNYRRVVYLLRDGRDAMISYFHYIKALNNLTDLSLMDLVHSDNNYMAFGKWHEHVEKWLENPYNADMITIRYEELHASPVETLNRFCEHIGIHREHDFLEKVVHSASFTNMKRKETETGFAHKYIPINGSFIRRGIVGSYKDEMPDDVLNDFLLQSSNALKKVGYLVDSPERHV